MIFRRFRGYQQGNWSFGRKRPHPTGNVQEKRAAIEEGLHEKKIAFTDLVQMGYWQTLKGRRAKAWRELGNHYYDPALESFKSANGPETEVGIFGRSGLGVYTTSANFRYAIKASAIRFDWSEAHVLLKRIDGVAERAREWWGPIAARKNSRRQATAAAEQRRHLERAYGLVTSVFAAIDRENPPDGRVSSATRSEPYQANLKMLVPLVDEAEEALRAGLQRSAQTRYGRGMFYGSVAVSLACAGIGLGFLLGGVPAAYGVALPAGAAGALVSVLQRMTSGSLRLDFNAGDQMLSYYGAVRPLIGGLLGYMIFVFLKGSLFPALSITTTAPLATYAGLGFVGGFNERWAQDMLVGSAKRLNQRSSETSSSSTPR
jgi:hypothetical protein